MEKRKKRGYWTKEKCYKEALKYKFKSDFINNSKVAYYRLVKWKLIDDACKHMPVRKNLEPSKWNKEACIEVAKKCKYKSEFVKLYNGAYSSSKNNNWLHEITTHFQPIGSKVSRCIYVYEFDDKSFYVGLTYNIDKRHKQHMKDDDSAVFKYMKKTNKAPSFKQVTDYIDYREVGKVEDDILKKYIKNGWKPLNKAKTGGLGSSIEKKKPKLKKERFLWVKENCYKEALKYNTRMEFQDNSRGAYMSACRNKWLNEICSHMELLQRDKWIKKEALIEAKKYNTKSEFAEKANGCYQICLKHGWMKEASKHMISTSKLLTKHTNESVIKELSSFNFMVELRDHSDSYFRGIYWWLSKRNLIAKYKKYLKT